MPPAGTAIENVSVDPTKLPETVPTKSAGPDTEPCEKEPETIEPDCDTVQDISPDPVLSEAKPEYVPERRICESPVVAELLFAQPTTQHAIESRTICVARRRAHTVIAAA